MKNSQSNAATRPSRATRRTILRAGATLAAGGLVSRRTAVQPVAAATDDAWPVQRFDTGNTAYNPDGSPLKTDVGVHVASEAAAGFSHDYLLADGTVYLNDAEEGSIGAIDLETGAVQWVTDSADTPVLPEFVEGDILATRAMDGTIYGIHRDDGGVASEMSVGRGVSLGHTDDGQWLAPVMDGTLVAGKGGSDDYQWKADIDGIGLRPAADGQRIYAAVLEGVSPDELTIETPSEMDASGHLYAIDGTDGSVLWDVSHDRFGVRQPAVADGTVYWPCSDGTLTAYDAETGDERWRFTADEGFNASVAITEDVVLAGNDDGRLYGIDRDSGEEVGSFETDGRVRGSPVVLGDVAFFGTDGHTAYAFDFESVEVLWEFDTDAPVRALTAGNGRVVVGTPSQSYVLGPSDEAPSGDGESGSTGSDEESNPDDFSGDESEDSRGFLTNDPDSSLAFLDDPVTLTWAGIGVSIVGIVMQLFGRQT